MLATRVEVASWLTVTLKEPLIASAVALGTRTVGEVPSVSVQAVLAFIAERLAREAAAPCKPAIAVFREAIALT